MKTYFMISWRNVWRQKRRSLVVIVSIVIGIIGMVLSMGFLNGMTRQMVDNMISTSLGHVAIHRKGFHDYMKLEYNFTPSRSIEEAVKQVPGLRGYAPRVKMQCMVRSSESSRGVMIVGIDPEREKTASKLYDYTLKDVESSFLSDTGADSILISKELGNKLDLVIGDRLVVMLQDINNKIVGVGLQVAGFYETPIISFDRFVVFTGIGKLQEITGIGKNISETTILLDDKNRSTAVKEGLISKINDSSLEVMSWQDRARDLVNAVALFDSMMFIFFAIVFVTVIFSIANTLVMAIMERFHEIGVMKSIGTRPSRIFLMIMLEAVNLGAVGLVSGVGISLLLIFVLSITGIDLSFYMDSMKSFGTGSVLYPWIRPYDVGVTVVIVMLTTLVAALYPAVKAARIKPLDALNFI